MKKCLSVSLLAWVIATLGVSAATLSVGDRAPKLAVSNWIKGGPVKELDPAQSYVVEFWATWCPPCRSSIPHLTELAHQFTNVTFIGISIWERGEDVQAKVTGFVETMGDKMDYAVALDTDNQIMAKTWMEAAGLRGIPSAFVVHEGRVAWMGHPMSLEPILATIGGGIPDSEARQKASAKPLDPTKTLSPELAALLKHHGDDTRHADPPLRLQAERFGMPAVALDNALYVLGGHSNYGLVGTVERLAPGADATDVLSPPIHPRRFHVAAAHGGKIYIAGGLQQMASATGVGPASAVFEEFDPTTCATRRLPDLLVPVCRPGIAVVGNCLYVVGGADPIGRRSAAVQRYDFDSGTWSRGADMPTAREGAIFAYHGRLYAPGGYDGTLAMRDFQVYDPEADDWSNLPQLPEKASAFQGVVVDHLLYIFGDFDELDRTVVYDFDTQQWARLELGYRPARHGGADRLGDDVIVAGGNVQTSPPYLARIQRFSIAQLARAPRREWTQMQPKPVSRQTCGSVASILSPRPAPLDPQFFHSKWKTERDPDARLISIFSRLDWVLPPRHLVLVADDHLLVHRANDGTLLHSIPLPPETRAKDSASSTAVEFLYIQDGDSGYVFGSRQLYEIIKTSSNHTSVRSLGDQFMCIADTGKLLSFETRDPAPGQQEYYALPVGPDRDVLLIATRCNIQLVDAQRRVLLDQPLSPRDRWIFRPRADGRGVEVLIIDRTHISCYDLVVPGVEETPLATTPPPDIKPDPTEMRSLNAEKIPQPAARSKIDIYTQLLDQDPDNVPALHQRGFLYAMLGNTKACRRDFEKALRLAPRMATLRRSYGWALLNLGEYAAAARQWERWSELDPAVPSNSGYHLALAYWADGQKEVALKIFNGAVARHPDRWISRDYACRFHADWTTKELNIMCELYDAWQRIYGLTVP